MNRSTGLEGVHGTTNAFDLEPARQPDRPDFSRTIGVLRRKMRRPFEFMVFVHCLWVWKGRTDVSEPVYRLGRGPWHHKRV